MKKVGIISLLMLCTSLVGCELVVETVETDWIVNDPHHQLGGCAEFISCPDGMKALSGGIAFKSTTVDDRIFVKDSHPSPDGAAWCHLVANDTDKSVEYKIYLVCGK